MEDIQLHVIIWRGELLVEVNSRQLVLLAELEADINPFLSASEV